MPSWRRAVNYTDPFGLAAVQSNVAQQMASSYWNNVQGAYRYQVYGPGQSVWNRVNGFLGTVLYAVPAVIEDVSNFSGAFVGNVIDQATLRSAADDAFSKGNGQLGSQLLQQADRQSDAVGNQLQRGLMGAAVLTGVTSLTMSAGRAGTALSIEATVPAATQGPSGRVLNIGGEGEVPGAINLNNLAANIRPVDRSSNLVPWLRATCSTYHSNQRRSRRSLETGCPSHQTLRKPPRHRLTRSSSPAAQSRVFSSSGGARVWLDVLITAGFQNVHVEGLHAVGVKP